MGVYIAEEAFLRGAEVTLIRVEPQYNLRDIQIYNVKELYNEIKNNLKNNDIMIHAAAVSDFTINNKSGNKLKSNKSMHLELTPTTKIFENIKKINKNILLVGFKAEYRVTEKELINRAYALLKSADADLVVANDVGKPKRGFDAETNEAYIVGKNRKIRHLNLADKRLIGNKILDDIKYITFKNRR